MALNLPEPSFIDRDPAQVTADLIQIYEDLTGKTLQPAQPERLFIDIIAYRETLLRIAIQGAAKQNLLAFASGDMLDFLGALVDCPRLPAQFARTTLRFTLTAAQDFDVTIAAGVERGSKDNLVVFATDALLTIPAGELTGDVTATATAAGIQGNGYLAGEVNQEIDPLAFVLSAVNLDITSGGAEVEKDDHYQDRIGQAPEKYSCAGPRGAYRYWAMTAHQDVIDAGVLRPVPGTINIYPLTVDGAPSETIMDLVNSTLSDEEIRPLNDTVAVYAPTRIDFEIIANVTLYTSCPVTDLQAQADLAKLLTDYAATLRLKLGADQVLDQIKKPVLGYPRVYSSPLASPLADLELAGNEWLNCTGVTVNIVGRVNG